MRLNYGLSIGNLFWAIAKGFPWRMIACDVSLSEFPRSTMFPHPMGIVIRGGTILGEGCYIYQNTTIGIRRHNDPTIGEGEPPAVIGNNVKIYANAVVLGPVHIGDNSIIAAGAVVLDDVPPNTVYISKDKMKPLAHMTRLWAKRT